MQALDSAISAGKQNRTFIVVLSPVTQIPIELERQFVVIEHDLPGREQLEQIARTIATEPGELPGNEHLGALLDAAAGLTRVEAENALSLSLIRHGRVAPEVLWELKGQALKKSGLLTLHRGGETFADLGGLDALKSFCTRALRSGRRADVRARGVLLLGPPGSGKSACAKALGAETGRPTLLLDVGSLMGSLIGQTECAV
jgi:SpoVK/Ycf46/Vps4 family AAA+-type ATPase